MTAKHIGAALRAFGQLLPETVEPLLLIGGAALIAFGAWQIYAPAGSIVAGTLLIVGVVVRARGE
jgi:hypothetical protein